MGGVPGRVRCPDDQWPGCSGGIGVHRLLAVGPEGRRRRNADRPPRRDSECGPTRRLRETTLTTGTPVVKDTLPEGGRDRT